MGRRANTLRVVFAVLIVLPAIRHDGQTGRNLN
jgi:hypothetical protein